MFQAFLMNRDLGPFKWTGALVVNFDKRINSLPEFAYAGEAGST
jgi:hypothetical protein